MELLLVLGHVRVRDAYPAAGEHDADERDAVRVAKPDDVVLDVSGEPTRKIDEHGHHRATSTVSISTWPTIAVPTKMVQVVRPGTPRTRTSPVRSRSATSAIATASMAPGAAPRWTAVVRAVLLARKILRVVVSMLIPWHRINSGASPDEKNLTSPGKLEPIRGVLDRRSRAVLARIHGSRRASAVDRGLRRGVATWRPDVAIRGPHWNRPGSLGAP